MRSNRYCLLLLLLLSLHFFFYSSSTSSPTSGVILPPCTSIAAFPFSSTPSATSLGGATGPWQWQEVLPEPWYTHHQLGPPLGMTRYVYHSSYRWMIPFNYHTALENSYLEYFMWYICCVVSIYLWGHQRLDWCLVIVFCLINIPKLFQTTLTKQISFMSWHIASLGYVIVNISVLYIY
mgnify:CR=1 FL=1